MKKAPSVSDGYGVWRELVIGSNRRADPDHSRAGSYGMWEYRAKRFNLTVKAQVYPDFGTLDANGPHLWGVVFPKQARQTEYDARTDTTKVVREHADEKRFGAKAPDLATAQAQAVECIARGGWDAIERNDNGTLKALDAYEDVPEGF